MVIGFLIKNNYQKTFTSKLNGFENFFELRIIGFNEFILTENIFN